MIHLERCRKQAKICAQYEKWIFWRNVCDLFTAFTNSDLKFQSEQFLLISYIFRTAMYNFNICMHQYVWYKIECVLRNSHNINNWLIQNVNNCICKQFALIKFQTKNHNPMNHNDLLTQNIATELYCVVNEEKSLWQ